MIRLLASLLATGAAADVRAVVDLSDQEMTVWLDGTPEWVWPVSTARADKVTPIGTFTPYLLERMHYSTLYDNAPMPWSIFFTGNFAIHGTTQVDKLGTPASAGCVRLAPENAKLLYEAVKAAGLSETRVVVQP